MKKLILLLFIPLVFTCGDDSGDDCNPIPDLTFDASSITENSAILNGSIYTPDCVESVTYKVCILSEEVFLYMKQIIILKLAAAKFLLFSRV